MFLREYLRMLSIVVAAMAVYYVAVNPWVEWQTGHTKKLTENFVRIDRSMQWWSQLYPEAAWQSQQPERLLTRRAEILYQSFESLGPGRYKLKPLTILVPQSGRNADTPSSVIMIENPAGAEVQFDSDVTLLSRGEQSATISSVHLEGEVLIRSLELRNGVPGAVSMEGRTSHLKIDGNRIWSPQEIDIQFGNSVFEGRDFVFTASQNILGKRVEPTASEGPFASLDHLEIIYVNRVDIELENGGILQQQATARLAENGGPHSGSLPNAHLLVQCKKSFHFDFQRMLATLNDRVVVKHLLTGYPTDQIEADRVDLQFAYRKTVSSEQSVAPEVKRPEFTFDDGLLALERVEAFGKSTDNANDESRWIEIVAPNFLVSCKTRWINVLLKENAIRLANQLPTETAIESSPVYLRRDNMQVWTPKLDYKMAGSDATNPGAAKHLGLLWAQGPGEATTTTSTGEVWTANWANVLTMRPDDAEDLVTVEGAAQIRSDRQGRFTAEKIEVWLKDHETQPSADALEANSEANPHYLPTRLQAFQDVIVTSPSLRAQVATLKLWFAHLTSGPPAAPTKIDPNLATTDPALTTTPTGIIQQPMTPVAGNPSTSITQLNPSSPQGYGPLSPLPAPNGLVRAAPSVAVASSQRRPLLSDVTTVTGATLEAKLLLYSDRDPIIDHLLLQGDVTMTKERVSESFALPVTITGDQIELEDSYGEEMIFHIYGQPARVLIGGGNVIGKSIHFDQHRQLLYMDQAGEMTVPPELLAQSVQVPTTEVRPVSSSLQAPPLMNPQSNSALPAGGQWLEAPRVAWNGQMTFDGHLAKLNQGVTIRGVYQSDLQTLWHLETDSDEMYVEVSGSAFNQKNNPDPTKVQTVQLAGNVNVVAAQTSVNLERTSIEQLQVPLLTVFPQQQLLKGSGPGSLLSRRINKKSATTVTSQSNVTNPFSSPNAASNSSPELQCVHLTYLGEMDGSYRENRVTFRQDVAAILGTVKSWTDALDVDRINLPGVGQTKLETNELSVYSTKDRPWVQDMEKRFPGSTRSAFELIAQGNVIVDANTPQGVYNVTASDGRYDGLNELLKVTGVPNRPATLRKQASTAEPNGMQVNLLDGLIHLRTGEMQLSTTNISGGLPTNFQPASGQNPAGIAGPNPLPGNNGGPAPAPANSPVIKSPRDFDVFQRPR